MDEKYNIQQYSNEAKVTHVAHKPYEPHELIPIRLFYLFCLICLISCSTDESVEPSPVPVDGTAIVFTALEQEPQTVTRGDNEDSGAYAVTRASLSDITSIFNVYGYKNMGYVDGSSPINYTEPQQVFPGYIVRWLENSTNTTVTNTNGWEYVNQQDTGNDEQTIKYWDWSATAYRFFGYTLGNATADPATDPATVTMSTTTTAVTFSSTVDASSQATFDAAPYFSKLWFSNGNTTTYPDRQFGQPVQLQFTKPFARVRFMFTFVDGLSFGREALKNISLHPTRSGSYVPTIATAGNVSVTYPLTGAETAETWTTSNTSGIDAFTIDYYEADDTYTPDDTTTPEVYDNTPEKWYTVLPALTQGSYTLDVSIVTDEPKTAVVPAEFMSWKPGYDYTYIFKINDGGSVTLDIIQVAINDWSNKKSSNHSVYNW